MDSMRSTGKIKMEKREVPSPLSPFLPPPPPPPPLRRLQRRLACGRRSEASYENALSVMR